VDGAQYHVLSSLTGSWAERRAPVLPDELIAAYTRYVNIREGVVTWDVPPNQDGTLMESFRTQLKALQANGEV